ncbi:MAG: class I SAM-dependent methyltransferase [Alphaproteobacteria bacterium]|nr:class I SAM-dependent methyltransferase [Alphaproteobacteria bacterium]
MADACLACGGRLETSLAPVYDTRFGIPNRYEIARCTACGLEQTLPRPTGPELGGFYAAHYNAGAGKGSRYAAWRERFFASPLYRLFLALDSDISFHGRRGRGRLLDIGCNEGRNLAFYQRSGFTVEGLETNPVARATAQSLGFTVHGAELEVFQPPEGYDVAVLSNVLEHALDPKEMLDHVARVLKPGGQLWISCPNARSWLRTVGGAAWINWHVPFHIVHFSQATLAATLGRAGWRVREADQQTPALWVAYTLLARLTAQPGVPTRSLRNPLAVLALMGVARCLMFPWLWLANRLGRGDCLIAIAEPPVPATSSSPQPTP